MAKVIQVEMTPDEIAALSYSDLAQKYAATLMTIPACLIYEFPKYAGFLGIDYVHATISQSLPQSLDPRTGLQNFLMQDVLDNVFFLAKTLYATAKPTKSVTVPG